MNQTTQLRFKRTEHGRDVVIHAHGRTVEICSEIQPETSEYAILYWGRDIFTNETTQPFTDGQMDNLVCALVSEPKTLDWAE